MSSRPLAVHFQIRHALSRPVTAANAIQRPSYETLGCWTSKNAALGQQRHEAAVALAHDEPPARDDRAARRPDAERDDRARQAHALREHDGRQDELLARAERAERRQHAGGREEREGEAPGVGRKRRVRHAWRTIGETRPPGKPRGRARARRPAYFRSSIVRMSVTTSIGFATVTRGGFITKKRWPSAVTVQ